MTVACACVQGSRCDFFFPLPPLFVLLLFFSVSLYCSAASTPTLLLLSYQTTNKGYHNPHHLLAPSFVTFLIPR